MHMTVCTINCKFVRAIWDKLPKCIFENFEKNIQLMLEFLKAPSLVLYFSCYTFMTFLAMFLLYSKCGQTSDLWQQLELPSEIESDLRDTVDWSKKWLVDFNTGKTQLVSFDQSNNDGSIDKKMDGSVLEKKSSFEMMGITFCKLDWGSYIISIAKTAS